MLMRGNSYNDEDCSTEAGFKSNGNHASQNHLNQPRPSFLSSGEYNSFIGKDRYLNFSPETLERS